MTKTRSFMIVRLMQLALLAAGGSLVTAWLARQPVVGTYTTIDSAGIAASARRINDDGVIAGRYKTPANKFSPAFLRDAKSSHGTIDRPGAIAAEAYGNLPLRFEINRGQIDPKVEFLARGRGYTLYLTSDEAVVALRKPAAQLDQRRAFGRSNPKILNSKLSWGRLGRQASAGRRAEDRIPASLIKGPDRQIADLRSTASRNQDLVPAVLRMKLVGANPTPRVKGLEQLPTKSNYFLGKDPQRWRTDVANYAKVSYEDVYPGIGLVYYGNAAVADELEYDFVVRPGAKPGAIKLAIQGASKLRVDARGDLVADLGGQEIRLHKPVVYQPKKSKAKNSRHSIEGSYVLMGDNQFGFHLSAYDPKKTLVIDPVLKYSTYLGGSADDWGSVFNFLRAVAVDPMGNAYVIGTTDSVDFPATAGAYQTEFAGGAGGGGGFINPFGGYAVGDVFVAKLNAAGSALVYSTYLGGAGDDYGEGIAVDAAGNAYLAGMTDSTDFPTKNPIQAANAGLADLFLAKLNATGTTLGYSTYLGGSDSDGDPMIALDPRGNLYFEAWTFSTDIPTANALQPASAGPPDTWAGKLNAAGSALGYSTYLGGGDYDVCGSDIVVDAAGDNYLNGFTCSTDFPTLNAFQAASAGNCDAFLTKLNPAGKLAYSTYLGGSDFDFIAGTAIDSEGNAYVAGPTFSSDFPTKNPFQAVYAGNGDTFVAKVNRYGTALVYSTYLGGTDFESAHGIVVDAARNSYVVGVTYSADFPTARPLQAANAGDADVYLTKLNSAGSALIFSTYLGGSGWEEPSGLALGRDGDVYIQGTTTSTDFPVVNALQPANAGGLDAFVARIRPITTSPSTSLSRPSSPTTAGIKKGGTTTLKNRPYASPFDKRFRPQR